MLKEILTMGGPSLLVPVAVTAAVMYLANWALGLERRRAERRREFLELWPQRQSDDDLWAQVALRHLVGTYLPRSVVQAALVMPNKAAALITLGNIWDFLELVDGATDRVRWKRKLYASRAGRRLAMGLFNAGYFFFALVGIAFLTGAARASGGLASTSQGFLGALGILTALTMLFVAHELKEASETAPKLILQINKALAVARAQEVANSDQPTIDHADPFPSTGG